VTAAAYADWLARGRNHQWLGRSLDALQCFRRALRESPRPIEARFHLGEVLWQLGRLDEALRSWRDAVESDPAFVAGWQALAEGSLGTGLREAAVEAAQRVLALFTAEVRARAVVAIARLGDDSASAACANEVADLVRAQRDWLAVPALGGSLALVLEGSGQARTVAAAILPVWSAEAASQLHPRLHAALCEHVAGLGVAGDAWYAAMRTRDLRPEDHDALRRAARAAAHARSPEAPALATAYASLCRAFFRPTLPLCWPRRTAGPRPRVVVLATAQGAGSLAASLHAGMRDAAVTLAIVGGHAGALPARSLALAAEPGLDDARRIAALDPDVLIDAAGLDAPSGPLLAQRPARRIVALASDVAHAPPLVDARLAALAAWHDALPSHESGGDVPDEATLEASWRAAVAAHQRGERDAASAGYAEILRVQPGFAPALYLAGVLARESGDARTARERFDAAVEAAPYYDDARIASLSAAGAAQDADAVARLSTPITPADAPALLRAGGLAWLAVRDGRNAASFFDAALKREPSDGETHYNLGVALQMQHRFGDAARAYQRALVCRPDLIAADFNLGVIFTALGNWDAAIAAYSTVIEREPRHVAAHKNLGEVLLSAGRIDAWLQHFRRFERQCPGVLPLALHALEASHYTADFASLDRYLEGLRHERFAAANDAELVDALEQLLYLLLYFDVEPEMVQRFAETYDRVASHVYGTPLPRRAARRPGKIRIGYLSADLRNHVMGKMMWQALRHHDRERFALHVYLLSTVRDEWTERFAGIADKFTVLAEVDDQSAVAAIAEDDLDLLVDLGTHTKGARPAILARKPARVQLTHVASAGTLGLRAVDFKLTDRYADVPENQKYLLETLLPMEGCVYPFRHIEPAAEHPYTRAGLGIADDAVVIGAFVNPLKLSRRCLTLWREILERIPDARLAFSPLAAGLRDVYVRLVQSSGIARDRIVFVPTGNGEAENQARYNLVDFVLDPLPYGGVNGTLEALDMHVPVVTLVGKRHGERTSYSILANLGVTDTVAETGRDYVDLAVRLATDRAFMREVRARIAAALPQSPLTDMVAHTRHLEAAYVAALARAAPEALASTRAENPE